MAFRNGLSIVQEYTDHLTLADCLPAINQGTADSNL